MIFQVWLCIMCRLTMSVSEITDVTISMKDPSIVQTESDGNVEVCAVLVKPSGGLEREVIVQLGTNQHTQQSMYAHI